MLYRILIALLSLVIVIGILIALLPTIVSTSWGKDKIVSWVNQSLPGKIEIENLDLHWGHGQTIEHLVLKDPSGQTILDINKIQSETALWQLLTKKINLGKTQIIDLEASINTDEKGISNLQYALQLNPQENPNIPPSSIYLHETNIDMILDHTFSLKMKGNTTKDNLDGTFDIYTLLPSFSNWENFLASGALNEAVLQAKIKNFPVALIDQISFLNNPKHNNLFHSLLGDKMDVFLDKESSVEGLAFNLTLLTPHFQGDLKGKIENNQFSLQLPALFHFEMVPQAINKLIKEITLHDKATFKIDVQEFTVPLSFFRSNEELANPCSIALKGQIESQNEIKLSTPSLKNATISKLEALFESPFCNKEIDLKITVEGFKDNFDPIYLKINASLNKPVHSKDLVNQLIEGLKINFNVNKFPLKMLSPKNDLLGEQAEIFGDLTFNDHAYDLNISLKTDHLTINRGQFKIYEGIELKSPLIVDYILKPDSINSEIQKNNISLEYPVPVQIVISKLKFSTDGESEYLSQINAPELLLSYPKGFIKLNNLTLNSQGKDSSTQNIQLSTQVSLLNQNGTFSPFLYQPGKFTGSAHLKAEEQGRIALNDIKAHFESDQTNFDIEGNILSNLQLVLTQPIKMNYKVTPEVLEALNLFQEESYPDLMNVPNLLVKADPFQINLQNPKLDNLTVKGSFFIDSILLKNSYNGNAVLKNIDMPWEINSPLNLARLNLKGEAHTDYYEKPSKLSSQFLISNWIDKGILDFNKVKVEIVSTLLGLPTSLMSSLVVKEDLTPLLGSIVDLELNTLIDQNLNTPGHWDMTLDSPLLHLKARLKIGEAITLYESSSKSAEIRWTLTPEGYNYLYHLLGKNSNEGIQIVSPVILKGFVSDLNVPLKKQTDGGIFNATFETNDIALNNQAFPLFKLKGQIHTPDVRKEMNFSLHSISKEPFNFSLNGQVSNPFHIAEGDINLAFQTKQLAISSLKALGLIDQPLENKLAAVFGNTIDAQLSVDLHKMNGPLMTRIEGKNGQTDLEGQINQGVVTLKKPFEVQTNMTPELSRTFLSENMPILKNAMGAEQPLKIVIEPSGFSFPLIPFKFDQIQIQKGAFHLGKVLFRNEDELKTILNIIKPINENQVIIWFTPIYFQLAKGKLSVNRVDMLVAQSFHLASWGQIDLTSHQMDMVIGIDEKTLKSVFGIFGLSSKDMFLIPIKGRNGKIDIDKTKILARIGALTAQKHAGDIGQILGGVFDIATSLADGPVPEPTTQPLPWENQEQKPKKEKERKKEKKIKEGIEKGASMLFDMLKRD